FMLTNIPEPHMVAETKEKKQKDTHSALSFRHFNLGIIAIFCYVGVEVGIANTTNNFMTTGEGGGGLGMDKTIAGTIAGTYWFLMMIGRLVGASIGAKVSSRTMLTTVVSTGIVLMALAIYSPLSTVVSMPVFRSDISFGLSEVPISVMFMILCGLCTSVMWGSIFNLAVEGLGKYTAMASGIFMVMVCGGGILPLIQGWVADGFGFLASYWVIIIALVYMLFYAQVGSKNVNKNIAVE
ncbi:MAG: MFS transporter, partial [Alistipes sp.]|nr:MFS transporter [Alistipes sp.]